MAVARAADPSQDTWDLVTRLAAALGRGNAAEFLAECDPAMPGYADLRVNVTALAAQADAESGIDPVRNEGDDRAREVEVDWSLHLTGRSGYLRATDRRSKVTLKIDRRGTKWKAVRIEPIGFFAPPSA